MSANTERLVADVKTLVGDAGSMVASGAAQTGERLAKLEAAAAGSAKAVLEKTRAAAATTDKYVHVHPWTAIGVAAGIGLVLGMLIERR